MTAVAAALPARDRGPDRAGRVLAVVPAALAVAIVAGWDVFVGAETRVFAAATGVLLPGGSVALADVVWYSPAPGQLAGFRVTQLCSTAVLLVPLLLVAALLLAGVRASARRVVAGLLAASGLVVVANTARFILIAACEWQWGRVGFDIAHRYAGSILVMVFFVGSLALLARLSVSDRRAG